MDQTASRLARPVDLSGNGDVVDLSAEMIALLQAKNATAVGVQIARTVDDLHRLMIGVEPDLTFLIDIDPVIGLGRAQARAGHEMRFEDMGLDLQRKMRAGFLALASRTSRFRVFSGDDAPDSIAARIRAAALGFLAGT